LGDAWFKRKVHWATDVQKKLGFSSPNLAVYHLDKLVEIGLAEKVSGEYHLTGTVDVGVLKQFTKIGKNDGATARSIRVNVDNLACFFLSQLNEVNFYQYVVLGFLVFLVP